MSRFRTASLVLALASAFWGAAGTPARADELQDINRLFRQGQTAPALDQLNVFIERNPKNAQAQFLKGLILTQQNKIPDAIQVFTTLTEDYPELPEPYNNLAVLYASRGQYDKSKNALEMAIRTHPSYATAHENLGDIYAKMASIAYDKALQLDRSNATAQTKLSMIQDLFTSNRPGATTNVARTGPGQNVIATNKTAARPVDEPPTPKTTTPPAEPEDSGTMPEDTPETVARDTDSVEDTKVTAAGNVADPGNADSPESAKESEVWGSVKAWAQAWSDKDAEGYLSLYAASFDPPDGVSRSTWEKQRKARIRAPKYIKVELASPEIQLNGDDRAVVSFKQLYRSNTFKSNASKTLKMQKVGGKWRIVEETVNGETAAN